MRRRLSFVLLAAACLLVITASSASALEFEWDGAPIAAPNAGSIGTDAAGRVYVPMRGAGKVNIYDNARGGNRLLASIGGGELTDPSSVALDVRGYIYVADAAHNAVVAYSPYYWGAPLLGSSGQKGPALGQFDGLGQIALDFEPRVFAGETVNGRIQALDPSRGTLTPLYAFGVTDPGGWGPVAGIAIDDSERFVVSSSDPAHALRYYGENGALFGAMGSVGSAPGQVSAPLGLAFDRLDRLAVADTGNDRVQLLSSIPSGLAPLAAFGSSGSGDGQFSAPSSISTAPGALAYVVDSGNGRIVRLRYDDSDRDGALDAADNCVGRANGAQGDIDSDGIGDDCDGDIDGDGLVNGADGCPLVKPYNDRNRDGCQDPFSTLKQILKRSKTVTLRGSARGGTLGIARVEVAIARKGHKPHYVRAKGTRKWRLSVKRSSLRGGRYRVYVRAVQRRSGLVEARKRSRAGFAIARSAR